MTLQYQPGYHAPEVLRLGWQGNIYDELVIDSFAGGGGASTGIELAIGRPVDIAINHDAAALAMHKANHPFTKHYCESVWDVDPREVCAGRPVGLAWFSPDCTHHSKARGGKPRAKGIRGLAWVVLRWAATVRPRVICLENVEEFRHWGPLLEDGQPCPKRKGHTFQSFVNALRHHGYTVDWRELKAHEYGAPTTRKRLFMVARCDGAPVVFPEPTHGANRKPVRTAAECIDWTIAVPSIFERSKPLVDATCRRIARGLMKFVINNPKPFLIQVNHAGGFRGQETSEPLPTLTAKNGHAVIAPTIIRYHGEKSVTENRGVNLEDALPTQTTENRFGLVAAHITKFKQHSTGTDLNEPLHTITAGGHSARPAGTPHGMGLVTAFISKYFGGGENGKQSPGSSVNNPLDTISAQWNHHALVSAYIVRQFGTSNANAVDAPLGTITATRDKSLLVAAFLDKYYGTGETQSVTDPLGTVTTKDRFGIVTVTLEGEEYVITDIGMRMLTPRELFRAQGFGDNYVIDPEFNGKPLTKTLQVRMVGNSVAPDVARAIVMANYVQQPLEMAAD